MSFYTSLKFYYLRLIVSHRAAIDNVNDTNDNITMIVFMSILQMRDSKREDILPLDSTR